jgi:hypothetical protein
MMHDVMEFFAVFSTGYFGVTDELGRGAGRNAIKQDYPEVFEFLDEIYGSAVLPPERQARRSR